MGKRGSTLTEVLVYSLLLVLNLVLAYAMWLAGNRYMLTTRAQVQVQQSANVASYRLNAELMEAAPGSLEVFPRGVNPDSTVVGVVFLSARRFQAPHPFVTDGQTGLPVWQKVVGYYLDADPTQPENLSIRALYRVEMVPSGFTPGTLVSRPSSLGITTSTLRGVATGNTADRRLVAHGITSPTPSSGASTASAHGGFNLFFQRVAGSAPDWQPSSPEYSQVSNPLYLVYRPLNTNSGVAGNSSSGPARNEVLTQTVIRMRN
ncbi:MAG: hypothetical protein AB1758_24020 [Candidatus Eremiobacterota bacterium]